MTSEKHYAKLHHSHAQFIAVLKNLHDHGELLNAPTPEDTEEILHCFEGLLDVWVLRLNIPDDQTGIIELNKPNTP